MSNENNLEQDLLRLFQFIEDSLSENQAIFILELIYVGEYALALEFIYDYLDDNEVLISENAYNLIQSLSSSMRMDTRDWHLLEVEHTASN